MRHEQVSRTGRLAGVLRLLLALAFLALLAAQLRVLPAVHDDRVRAAPGQAGSGWLLTVAELELLCVQVVVVCTWRLLDLLAEDRAVSEAALVWVDVVVGAVATAWLLLLGALAVVLGTGDRAGPAVVALVLLLVVGAVAGLLVLVLRALLRQAAPRRAGAEAGDRHVPGDGTAPPAAR